MEASSYDIDEKALAAFISQYSLELKDLDWLKGDASFRRYARFSYNNTPHILMAVPTNYDSIEPFIAIGSHLSNNGIHTPEILSHDISSGFAALEDLGAESFSFCMEQRPNDELPLYKLAIDALVKLQHAPLLTNIPHYDETLLMNEALLLTDWFLTYVDKSNNESVIEEYKNHWLALMPHLKANQEAIIHRDYHVENLMYCNDASGTDKVGVIDFQDAVIGSLAYDLVSLTQDARRDVSEQTEQACIDYYLSQFQGDKDDFMKQYWLYGIQRNCKILGIFVRLAKRDNKTHYLPYLGRVWNYIERSYSHIPEEARDLVSWLKTHIEPHMKTLNTEVA